jgi:hypothetical protein
VDAAVIDIAGVEGEAGAAGAVGIAEGRRVAHIADGADRQIFAHLPPDPGRVIADAIGQVDQLAKHVRHRFVDRASLEVVEQAGGELGHAVGQFVGHHVVG